LVLLGFAAWALTRRPNELIQDSKNFTEALEIWQPVIGLQCRTPREIKRFLNRVRYIAMRWRKPSRQRTLLERLADWVQTRMRRTRPIHQDAAEIQEINEAAIVLMAALEGLGGAQARSHATPDVSRALDQHQSRFGEIGEDWRRFRDITGEIEVN